MGKRVVLAGPGPEARGCTTCRNSTGLVCMNWEARRARKESRANITFGCPFWFAGYGRDGLSNYIDIDGGKHEERKGLDHITKSRAFRVLQFAFAVGWALYYFFYVFPGLPG